MIRALFALSLALAAAPAIATPPPTALVIHGGAGVIERSALSPGDEREVRAALDRALDAGGAVLKDGGAFVSTVAEPSADKAAALAQAVWHFTLIRTRTREGCFKAFRINHWLGATVFAGIAGSYLLRLLLTN